MSSAFKQLAHCYHSPHTMGEISGLKITHGTTTTAEVPCCCGALCKGTHLRCPPSSAPYQRKIDVPLQEINSRPQIWCMWAFLKLAHVPGFPLIQDPEPPRCSGALQTLCITRNQWFVLDVDYFFLPVGLLYFFSRQSEGSRRWRCYLFPQGI